MSRISEYLRSLKARRAARDESGQDLVEYALALGVVTVAVLLVMDGPGVADVATRAINALIAAAAL